MAPPSARPRESLLGRVVVALAILFLAWLLLQIVVGWVFSIVRALVILALFAVVAWVVLIGRPDRRD
jgi:hypothetical protein